MIDKLLILKLITLMVLTSCSNQKRRPNSNTILNYQTDNYKQVAFNKFGTDTVLILSPKENFVLCKKAIDKSSLNPNILSEFFVYDIDNEKILYEDKISGAEISWTTNTKLLITKQGGITTSPEDTGKIKYIYNLKTNKKENLQRKKNNK